MIDLDDGDQLQSANMHRPLRKRLFYLSEYRASTERSRSALIIKYLAMISVVTGLIFFVYRSGLIEVDKFILIAGLLSLLLRLISSVYFISALLLLIYVPVLQLTGHKTASDSFAIYVFYLLCFGTVSAILQFRSQDNNID